MKSRGYFGIGIYHAKTRVNYGTLFRTAQVLGADFIFTIGARFKPQCSDTMKSWKHVPLFEYQTFEQFYNNLPYDCQLVGIELNPKATNLKDFNHPERAIYLLGSENDGLPTEIMNKCHHLIKLEGEKSLNVAVAGSIVMYHRIGM